MDVKVNLVMPEALYNESQALVKKGLFSNYSELVRHAIRAEISRHKQEQLSEEERKVLKALREGHLNGNFVSDREAARHGVRL
jgi:Arc/MetJ-type ribon-helix-helix transcriptional regulator